MSERPQASRYEQNIRKWIAAKASSRKFEAAAAGTELELSMLGIVGETMWWDDAGGILAKDVQRVLAGNPDATLIRILIDSPGGDLPEGVAIMNLLKRHPARVEVEVVGEASSAASVIAMAGDKISMHEGTVMMVHRASTIACGFASELRTAADSLDACTGGMIDVYTSRTQRDRAEVESLVNAETWMTAADAVKEGFADAVIKGNPKASKAAASTSRASSQQFDLQIDASALDATATRIEAAVARALDAAQHPTQAHQARTAEAENKPMNPILLSILALSATASDTDVVQAVQALHASRKAADDRVKAFEDVAGKTGEEAVGTIAAFKASHERLPVVEKELADSKTAAERTALGELIKSGRESKKLTKALADNIEAQVTAGTMSLTAARSMVEAMCPQPHLDADPVASRPEASGAATPSAFRVEGKAFEDMSFKEQADLRCDDEVTFQALKSSWEERGKPKAKKA